MSEQSTYPNEMATNSFYRGMTCKRALELGASITGQFAIAVLTLGGTIENGFLPRKECFRAVAKKMDGNTDLYQLSEQVVKVDKYNQEIIDTDFLSGYVSGKQAVEWLNTKEQGWTNSEKELLIEEILNHFTKHSKQFKVDLSMKNIEALHPKAQDFPMR